MLKIYYDNTKDYRNVGRFTDQLEGSGDYNSFASADSTDFYYKTNNRLETLKLDMPNFITLATYGNTLKPTTVNTSKLDNTSTEITYFNNGLLTKPTITTI